MVQDKKATKEEKAIGKELFFQQMVLGQVYINMQNYKFSFYYKSRKKTYSKCWEGKTANQKFYVQKTILQNKGELRYF